MSDADSDKAKARVPEQKVGDTPTPPWAMPTPEEKQAARPVRRALKEALADIKSEADADAVINDLETRLGGERAEDVVAGQAPTSAAEAAQSALRFYRLIPDVALPEDE